MPLASATFPQPVCFRSHLQMLFLKCEYCLLFCLFDIHFQSTFVANALSLIFVLIPPCLLTESFLHCHFPIQATIFLPHTHKFAVMNKCTACSSQINFNISFTFLFLHYLRNYVLQIFPHVCFLVAFQLCFGVCH